MEPSRAAAPAAAADAAASTALESVSVSMKSAVEAVKRGDLPTLRAFAPALDLHARLDTEKHDTLL